MGLRICGLALLIGASVAVCPSFAQVIQNSTVTPGHPAGWVNNGVIGDGGPPTSGALSGVGVTSNSIIGYCQNTQKVRPFSQMCWGLTDSIAQITLQGVGETTPPLQLCIGGTCEVVSTLAPPTFTYNSVPGNAMTTGAISLAGSGTLNGGTSSTLSLQFPASAPHAWVCDVTDLTTNVTLRQISPLSASQCSLSASSNMSGGDAITYTAAEY